MEIRRTTQFLSFALGTRSPANPNFPKPKHYVDPNDAKLNFPKDKTPYYDPVSKTVKVPGKDSSMGKNSRRRSTAGNKKKKGKKIKDKIYEEEDIIKPQPIEN